MTAEQGIVFAVLLLALVLFVTERWRYDIVALLALLAVTLAGVVPGDQAFSGFGHPAVVTVAAVLVLSRGLQNSGVVDMMVKWMLRVANGPSRQVASLTGLVALLSGFINNVGAVALLLPMAVRIARKSGNPPSLFLMPLAFGSLLGGMTTLIGTPPNIIIATFRDRATGEPFRMFDFTPVGIGVVLAGVLYMSLVGWRLIPKRIGQSSREELFCIQDYLAEVRVPEDSKVVGKPLRDLEAAAEAEVTIVGLVRGEWRVPAPGRYEFLRAGDVLLVEAGSEALKTFLDATNLELVGSKQLREDLLGSDEVALMEAVIMPNSPLEGNTVWTMNLRWRYGVNLLGVSRQGERLTGRLRSIHFKAGDVILLQGNTETLQQALPILGCLPLAERGLRLGQPRRTLLAIGIFGLAVVATAIGLLAPQSAFVSAAVAMLLCNLLSLREAYESIDWPVIVLLGAMIPVGQALEITGGAALVANGLLEIAGHMPAAFTLAIVLLASMILTPLINNAAAAVLMAPIAINVAQALEVSVDPFLMAVCIGSSCDFLTPIGHQSNTLVMGPGGYKFGDYSRVGLPLEAIVATVSIPLILWFWPLAL